MPYDVFLILKNRKEIKVTTELNRHVVGEILPHLLDLSEVEEIKIKKWEWD